ncbi:MAG: transporter permease [Paenibacillaceae bacterium]|jgi:putative aldouronate transport system permease protein|nr:transporter permease [Paenibacillaceae bacterium]
MLAGKWKAAVTYTILYVFLAIVAFSTLYPFLQVIATSFSSSRAINSGDVFLWPVDFNLQSYRSVFTDGQIFVAMKNTVIVTAAGLLFNMVCTILAAYPLSKKRLKGRAPFLLAITFSMVVTVGIIPNFLLIKQLGIMNTYWSLWLPGLLSTYNMFVMKSFFEGLPEELEESASIEGGNDMTILTRIILPLSKPVLAALSLFYAVGWWNSYFNVLLYIRSTDKATLMVKLLQMITEANPNMLSSGAASEGLLFTQLITPESIRATSIVVSIAPIFLVYPFLQKYFVKGVLIGSVKG